MTDPVIGPCPDGVTVRIETLTVAGMKELLRIGGERSRRKLRPAHVRWLNGMMMDGSWLFTGEPIIVTDKGYVKEGQHRLHAAILAGRPLCVVVIRGVPDEDEHGQGISWTTGDMFDKKGCRHANTLAAAVRWLYLYEKNAMLANPKVAGFHSALGDETRRRNPGLQKSVDWVYGEQQADGFLRLLPPAPIAFAHYVMHREEPDGAESFYRMLSADSRGQVTNPVRTFKRMVVNTRINQRRTIPALTLLVFLFKAFSCHIEGRQLKVLKWKRYGENVEGFPPMRSGAKSHGETIKKTQTVARGLDAAVSAIRDQGWLTIIEAAQKFHMHPSTIHAKVKSGGFKKQRIGRLVYVRSG